MFGTAALDAFARLRVSTPETVSDSKQLHDKNPLFWDESITDGSGNATSTHSTVDAATTMHVESGDTIIRQTKTHWAYQPGKSQLCIDTANLSAGGTGVTARVGSFTATDGVFFESSGGDLHCVVRKNSSDTKVSRTTGSYALDQESWNGDKLNGNGPSGITIDPSKVQILFIAFEWLGVGSVIFGFFVNGEPIICHIHNHANRQTAVYMSTPNLPVRYEIASTGDTAELQHICSTIISEGGRAVSGVTHNHTTDDNPIAGTTGNIYAVLGIRLKSTHLDANVVPIHVAMLAETANDNFEWFLCVNPTIAGTFTYNNVTNSAVQLARGATANTITNNSWDIRLSGGLGSTAAPNVDEIDTDLMLGSQIDGTPDEFVLAFRPISNCTVHGTLTAREIA
jgi:hypothetical protein